MTTDPVRVLGISGSLRKRSLNGALLRAAIRIATEDGLPIVFETADIGALPLYDEDLRAAGWPEPVARLRRSFETNDAVLFVTPEYNYSVPGVLKNAIDWASRPDGKTPSPMTGKPFAVMGVSGGMSGTMRAQYHLRQIAVFLDMHAVNKPEIFVRQGNDAFDADLNLKDETVRKLVGQLLGALVAWTRRLGPQV